MEATELLFFLMVANKWVLELKWLHGGILPHGRAASARNFVKRFYSTAGV
jgi:hypothetical protein